MQRPTPRTLVGGTWTLEAPVDPGLLPAAFGDRCHTRLLLQCGGRGIACALVAKGDEEAGGGENRPHTHQAKPLVRDLLPGSKS